MSKLQNAFFKLAHGDPYAAVSFDLLHFQDGGLWGAHLFVQVKARILKLSNARASSAQVDQR